MTKPSYIKNVIVLKDRREVEKSHSQVWETNNSYIRNDILRIEVSRNMKLTNPFFVWVFELSYFHHIYDSYGLRKDSYWEEIEKGDKLMYLDTKHGKNSKGKKKSVKVPLYGIWDGEKVQFDDEDKTVVRTIRWLEKVVRTLRKSTIKELKDYYSTLITNHEKRFIEYKEFGSQLYKDKNLYKSEDFEWLRVHFKELKTNEERVWKSLVAEWTEIKQDYGI